MRLWIISDWNIITSIERSITIKDLKAYGKKNPIFYMKKKMLLLLKMNVPQESLSIILCDKKAAMCGGRLIMISIIYPIRLIVE